MTDCATCMCTNLTSQKYSNLDSKIKAVYKYLQNLRNKPHKFEIKKPNLKMGSFCIFFHHLEFVSNAAADMQVLNIAIAKKTLTNQATTQ